MHIDWSQTQVYNTLMSVATGVALLMLVRFGLLLLRGKQVNLEGWSLGFAVPGLILTLTGAHMTLTWPLSKVGFPYDDIIFGEPTFAFGAMLLAGSILLWRKSKQTSESELISSLIEMVRPLSYFAAAMGLALFSIAIAGVDFQLFAAPPEEPISGNFADYPMIEAIFISSLYAFTGIGATLLPFGLNKPNSVIPKIIGYAWTIAGVLFVLFGAMNYYTHIGLILNTM